MGDEAMAEVKSRFGYFALLSNEIKDPIAALEIYQNKDVIEKAFSSRLNCRRTLVSSELSLDGKFFVEFVALIILSYIKKHKQAARLFSKYTLQGFLDELDGVELFEVPGRGPIFGEILERQVKIFEAMNIPAPKSASLCISGIEIANAKDIARETSLVDCKRQNRGSSLRGAGCHYRRIAPLCAARIDSVC